MVNKGSKKSRFTPTKLSMSVVVALAGLAATSAQAFSIDTGNPDIEMRWDNTVRYNAGWRMEAVDQAYYRLPANDESAGHFKKGDMVTNRVDILSELDFVYQGNYGARVSAALWSENAYGEKSKTNPALTAAPVSAAALPSNFGPSGNYSPYAKRYITGASGEFLDAFVFGNFNIADTSLKVKLGQHNVYWGESLYSVGDGVSAGQGPVDTIKAASSPGVEAKELFMPLNQISAQWQLSSEVSLNAQYLFDWKPYRLSANGTYFNSSDGGGNPLGSDPAYAKVTAVGNIVNLGAITPGRDGGDYGVALRWSPGWLDGTVGFYYRKFDEKTPWNVTQANGAGPRLPVPFPQSPFANPANLGVRLSYARDTELYGISLSKAIAGISVGTELSYRRNSALNSVAGFFVGANNGGTPSVLALSTTPSYSQVEGARGDTWHWLINGIYLLPKTSLWEGGTVQGELVYQRLDKVTKNAAVYFSEDYACKVGYAYTALAAHAKNKGDGCATKDSLSFAMGFTPEWPQAFPSWDLAMPTSFSYGLKGNSPAIGGSYEGAYKWSVGLRAKYQSRYEFTLAYSDAHVDYKTVNGVATTANSSSDGGGVVNNKGWLSFNFKTTF